MRAILLAALGAAFSFPALAEPIPCGPYDTIAERLSVEYDEQPTGRGLDSKGLLLELWASEKTGTWTALVVRPDGIACVAQAGEGWGPVTASEPPGEIS
jgi:hypothetical protein